MRDPKSMSTENSLSLHDKLAKISESEEGDIENKAEELVKEKYEKIVEILTDDTINGKKISQIYWKDIFNLESLGSEYKEEKKLNRTIELAKEKIIQKLRDEGMEVEQKRYYGEFRSIIVDLNFGKSEKSEKSEKILSKEDMEEMINNCEPPY